MFLKQFANPYTQQQVMGWEGPGQSCGSWGSRGAGGRTCCSARSVSTAPEWGRRGLLNGRKATEWTRDLGGIIVGLVATPQGFLAPVKIACIDWGPASCETGGTVGNPKIPIGCLESKTLHIFCYCARKSCTLKRVRFE